ncbi:hypothetical protein PXH59_00280 (plasmid) [Xenorhabdus sp. SF857]|uniref:hypothetical protein n=1 Tax=Xenorhabdus bakwenae TaxID=3026967 RepID=UPI002557E906|nr:hypothetical protein [Xenorhabdus sp. SF857]WFQ78119.1 hypothetical protein PXH59_00280 [Xenorhabdus sp. SF857]
MQRNKVTIGSPLYFYQITPEGPLVGEWQTCKVAGEHNTVWLVEHNSHIYAVDKHKLVSERVTFYTQMTSDNEPKGYYALSDSLRQFFMANRHIKMPYPIISQLYKTVNDYVMDTQHGY